MHSKLLIVGRSGCGKDTLRCELENRGVRFVKSYATRKPRFENEDTHIFVTTDEADKIKQEQTVIAETEIDGNIYFATAGQVDAADAYIIDPNGVRMLSTLREHTPLIVTYISADEEIRRMAAIARADDKQSAADTFDTRTADEEAQFAAFEKTLHALARNDSSDDEDDTDIPKTIVVVESYVNDFVPSTINIMADRLVSIMRFYEHIHKATDWAVENGILNPDETRIEHVPYMLVENDAELAKFMRNILYSLPIDTYSI